MRWNRYSRDPRNMVGRQVFRQMSYAVHYNIVMQDHDVRHDLIELKPYKKEKRDECRSIFRTRFGL
jgi:hypothetical protein